jgi:electron transfer flavoprotein alpha subunit
MNPKRPTRFDRRRLDRVDLEQREVVVSAARGQQHDEDDSRSHRLSVSPGRRETSRNPRAHLRGARHNI